MRVEELIIDGFKSYSDRTHITGWDPEFNAITGLNGSGKSNILDAICFVLGIKNLSNVRVSSLNDLVYKRGQAGKNKATVTIVFDNSDREKSPVGYEQFPKISVTRQFVIQGKNKYLINGHTAQQHTVETFFQSVQLNVNNPHFLIMQGKITKVLNMKPPEILAMIEEAAGTRMFEEKRDKALHTIGKKEKKLQEIMSLLEQEITPKLDKLRQEKRAYLEFQKTEVELDVLRRLTVAHEYHEASSQLEKAGSSVGEQQGRLTEMSSERDLLSRERRAIEAEIATVTGQRDEEVSKGGRLAGLEGRVRAMEVAVVKVKTRRENAQRGVVDERATLQGLREAEEELQKALADQEGELSMREEGFVELKRAEAERVEKLRKAEELIQTLTTGMTAEEGRSGTGYQDRVRVAKTRVAEAEVEAERTRMKMGHLRERIPTLQATVQRGTQADSSMEAERMRMISEIERMTTRIQALGWDAGKEEEVRERRRQIQQDVEAAEELVRKAQSGGGLPFFQYSDPQPSFDRGKVKGLVADLIRIPPEHTDKATALQVAAGGALYHVVVEDEVVASSLIQRGRLRKRVTMIPLNKIASSRVGEEKVRRAQSLAPGKVDLALHLIGYPEEVERAMEHVFGSCLVCVDSATAAKVTFDDRVKMKSVTYDGDVYSPAGTLQGGSRAQGPSVLARLERLHSARRSVDEARDRLRAADEEWRRDEGRMAEYARLERERGLGEHQLGVIERQLAASTRGQAQRELEEVEAELREAEGGLQQAMTSVEVGRREVEVAEREMHEYQGDREGVLKRLRRELAADKATHAAEEARFREAQRETETRTFQMEQLNVDISKAATQLTVQEGVLKEAEELVRRLALEEEEGKVGLEEATALLHVERATVVGYEAELEELTRLLREKGATETELSVAMRALQEEVDGVVASGRAMERRVRALQEANPWIEDHKERFGRPGTPYDFAGVEGGMRGVHGRLQKLQAQFEGLRRSLNRSVITNLDSTEKREAQLRTMALTVQRDKGKIEETITQLDEYKRAALEKTWVAVNRDFGEIFGTLLDGNTCKLEPIEGKDLADGLEIKVCLGGVWKSSLTELSGGQRSLVALALILSMMQFKPAPMYILDEVDAALDPSHTQNIGQLFKTRFKGSQFIVVSLKDGMFTNANVLFRTKFRDGGSVVERTEARKKVQAPPSSRGR